MTTLPPPEVKKFSDDSIEKKVYGIVEALNNYLPIMNDRNRLGFALYKYVKGEGDEPEVLAKTMKLKLEGISEEEIARLIKTEIDKIK
ncbi:MAG: hypothetical protein AUK34_08925 [Ignavibacteria bacterium CG2_30_36_16]|nr:hypothetical protein [Ignavibacteria bacterium]OIP58511.1 MAG: hypothetical protein AUK34_08925 [Ignavibacteria bacterium CG2_30_36_16]PJB01560.1 MAG: hypothetical protein CO127_03150 [Ignavibacteria bacterium CG_4_9_14_3_um_filter_36_18]